MELTDEEREYLIKELTERMKDIVFMNAEQKVRGILGQIEKTILTKKSKDTIAVNYTIELGIGDFQQMLGRVRRRHKKVIR
jgi:predicted glycosyltransferase